MSKEINGTVDCHPSTKAYVERIYRPGIPVPQEILARCDIGVEPVEDPVHALGTRIVAKIMDDPRIDPEEGWSIFRHEVAVAVRDKRDVSPALMQVAGVHPDGTTVVPVPRMSTFMA